MRIGHQLLYHSICKYPQSVGNDGRALETNYCASMSPNLCCVSTIVRRAITSVSDNVRRYTYEQIYYSSLMPRTYLCARLLETLD